MGPGKDWSSEAGMRRDVSSALKYGTVVPNPGSNNFKVIYTKSPSAIDQMARSLEGCSCDPTDDQKEKFTIVVIVDPRTYGGDGDAIGVKTAYIP